VIYGKNFVWLHLGKTGGTTTNYLFSKYPDIVEHSDLDSEAKKHDNLSQCKGRFPHIDFSTKDIIFGFRKIETWIASHNNHARISWGLDHKTLEEKTQKGLIYVSKRAVEHFPGIVGIDTSTNWAIPDACLNQYLQNIKIKHYIRQECLVEDFIKISKEYNWPENKTITEMIGNEKVLNPGTYPWNYKQSEDQIEKIHSKNPLWMSIQNKIYS